MASQVVKIDLVSQAFAHDPFPVYARWHRIGPVFLTRFPIIGKTWVATTHEAVNEVLKDNEVFVREPKKVGKTLFSGKLWWLPRRIRVLSENMMQYDNPDHRRLRKLVDQAFSRHSVENMRDRIADLCDGLLDRLAGKEQVDLLEEWARPLPLAVICELLGLPDEDRPKFTEWARRIFSTISLLGILRIWSSISQLMAYFRQHFEECRQHPRPGLMTALVQAEQDGDKLSENELLAMAFLLLVAGFETTVHLLSGGTQALMQAPEQKERLLADWSLAPSAVEELLRFVSPVQVSKHRYVVRDLEFHGQQLRRGDWIMALLGAANADPAVFPNPEKLDLTRSPNPQVSFGSGMHFCLGAQLARVEGQVGLERLFTRFPRLSLAVPEPELKYTGRLGMRALVKLPVRLFP
jgi:cytochrome P450